MRPCKRLNGIANTAFSPLGTYHDCIDLANDLGWDSRASVSEVDHQTWGAIVELVFDVQDSITKEAQDAAC